jgi:AraC family transcriptional regulator of adaptative response / DNA-3-methyladenine glycosylase II
MWAGTQTTVGRAVRLIDEGALDREGVDELSGRLGVTARHLRRLFVEHLGSTPNAVAQFRRVMFAKTLITETQLGFSEIAFGAGYSSIRRFNEAIRSVYDRNPGQLRRLGSSGSNDELMLRIAYRPPFHWPALIGFLEPRAMAGLEVITPESYQRNGMLRVRHDAERNLLLASIQVPEVRELRPKMERIRRLFDVRANAAEIGRHLGPLGQRYPGIRVPGCWDGFELVIRAILGQQVTVKGASTLANRLVARFGPPLPQALEDAPVEEIGLPKARAETIRLVARAIAAGGVRLDGSQTSEEFRARLEEIPGMGPWTSNYIAMRALGDPDAFPSSDLGLLKASGAKSPKELERMAEAWRPWRAYAAMSLWHSLGDRT